MCKSIAEGGQRCAHHSRELLATKAAVLHATTKPSKAYTLALSEWESAAVAYASTLEGHREITTHAEDSLAAGDKTSYAHLINIARRGQTQRDVNQSVRSLLKEADLTPEQMGGRTYTATPASDLLVGDVVLVGGRNQVVEAKKDILSDTILRLRDGSGLRSTTRTAGRRVFRKLLLGVMAAVASVTAVTASASAMREPDATVSIEPIHVSAPSPTEKVTRPEARVAALQPPKRPAPTSLDGYQRMFDRVDVNEWGGADISYSVDLPDGRRVWLYGDTLSGYNGLVRNTALVQHGGDLHVSHGGKQVIPSDPKKDGRKTIYWPEVARVVGDGTTLHVVNAPISTGGESVWDFHRTGPAGKSRVAAVDVDTVGNLTFRRWIGWEKRPDIDYDETGPTDVRILGDKHWGYAETIHSNITLADGSNLITMSQNWDDPLEAHEKPDGTLRYHDWRPLFFTTKTPP